MPVDDVFFYGVRGDFNSNNTDYKAVLVKYESGAWSLVGYVIPDSISSDGEVQGVLSPRETSAGLELWVSVEASGFGTSAWIFKCNVSTGVSSQVTGGRVSASNPYRYFTIHDNVVYSWLGTAWNASDFSGADGFTLHAENEYPLNIASTGNQLLVYNFSRNNDVDPSIFFYGDPPVTEPAEPAVTHRQFTGFVGKTYKYDVLNIVNGVVTVRALNVDMLITTSLERPNTASGVDIRTQLKTRNFIPRFTIPSVESGDVLVVSTGATAENPPTDVTVSGNYEVQGFVSAGDGLRQEIIATLQ